MDHTLQLTSLRLILCLSVVCAADFLCAQDINSFGRIQTLQTPWFVDFADLNGDNIKDMVGVYGNSSAEIKIFHGNANGTFAPVSTFTGAGEYYKVFLEDLNGDDVPDVIARSNISGLMLLSSPTGYYPATLPALPPYFSDATLFADFNNDGQKDLFIGNQVFLIINGTFQSKAFIVGNGHAAAVDYNNDNLLDIVMSNPGGGTVNFYPGNGDGTFGNPLTKNLTVMDVLSHDLNADGFVDILLRDYNGGIVVLYNDASYSFSQSTTIQLGHLYYSTMNIFDIDHDGALDLVTSNDNHIQYRPILPNGTFGNEKTIELWLGSLRGLLFKDAVGEPFPDMVVMSGFGTTRIYSDKINATLEFTGNQKVYDALPFSNFYQASRTLASTVSYSGLATPPKDVGTYEVTVTISDPNYEGDPLKGTLSITKKVLTVDPVDVSITQGDPIPLFELSYSGFAGMDNAYGLADPPVAATLATPGSDPGEYEITVSGGSDENYTFEYTTGVLTIEVVTGISDVASEIDIFPNPAADKIRILSPQWTHVKIYDVSGRNVITRNYSEEPISLTGCQPGLYFVEIKLVDGNTFRQRLNVINRH